MLLEACQPAEFLQACAKPSEGWMDGKGRSRQDFDSTGRDGDTCGTRSRPEGQSFDRAAIRAKLEAQAIAAHRVLTLADVRRPLEITQTHGLGRVAPEWILHGG